MAYLRDPDVCEGGHRYFCIDGKSVRTCMAPVGWGRGHPAASHPLEWLVSLSFCQPGKDSSGSVACSRREIRRVS